MSTKLGPTAFLKSLGNTSQEVADSLRKLNVRGRGGDYDCPIAVAVNTHANGWGGIRVSKCGYLTYNDCQIMDPQTTEAVRQFVKDFDAGMYPDLVG
jgi:hypothetical protein